MKNVKKNSLCEILKKIKNEKKKWFREFLYMTEQNKINRKYISRLTREKSNKD